MTWQDVFTMNEDDETCDK